MSKLAGGPNGRVSERDRTLARGGGHPAAAYPQWTLAGRFLYLGVSTRKRPKLHPEIQWSGARRPRRSNRRPLLLTGGLPKIHTAEDWGLLFAPIPGGKRTPGPFVLEVFGPLASIADTRPPGARPRALASDHVRIRGRWGRLPVWTFMFRLCSRSLVYCRPPTRGPSTPPATSRTSTLGNCSMVCEPPTVQQRTRGRTHSPKYSL